MSGVVVTKKSSPILSFLVIVVIVIPLGLIAVGKYEPLKLVIIQEQMLGLMKGGVSPAEEKEIVDGCVLVQVTKDAKDWRAVRRVERTVKFADGSQLKTIYSEPPQPTGTQCP